MMVRGSTDLSSQAHAYYTARALTVLGGRMMSSNHPHRYASWPILLLVSLIVIVPLLMVVGLYMAGAWSGTSTDFGMMGSLGGWWPFMMIVPIVVVLVIVALILLVLGEPARPVQYAQYYSAPGYSAYGTQPAPADPMAILDRRLASGEITVDEYNRLKDEIRKR